MSSGSVLGALYAIGCGRAQVCWRLSHCRHPVDLEADLACSALKLSLPRVAGVTVQGLKGV